MSLTGLQLSAQYSQFSNSATPISNATLALETLEDVIAQADAQLVWIGKGRTFQSIASHYHTLIQSAYTTGGELAHPMKDLT
jgi:hypothetical protein